MAPSLRRPADARARPRARAEEAQELLRLQGRVHAPPSFLRRPLPRVRRAQLRQALPDRVPRRARGPRDGRPSEDRLPDRAQDAPGGAPGHRHHALPPRRRRCATPASPTSRSGRTACTSTASTCGTRRASRSSPATSSTRSSRLDILVNNACQTVRRPPGFYAHLLESESRPASDLPAEIARPSGEPRGA